MREIKTFSGRTIKEPTGRDVKDFIARDVKEFITGRVIKKKELSAFRNIKLFLPDMILKFDEAWTPEDFMGLLLFPETWTTYPPDMILKFSEPWSA